MPSITHEGLLQPFELRPAFVAEVLSDMFGVKLPEWRQVRLGSGDLTEVVPTEFRADQVVIFSDAGRAVLAVVIEVQLREDKRKRYTWPVYLTTLRARLQCPTILLVVSPRAATAAWCADRIELGHPDLALTPLVLGSAQMPVVTDVAQAREHPELAVLSALAHGRVRSRRGVLDALAGALERLDPDRAEVYHDVVYAALPAAARRYWERLMSTTTYQFRSEFALRHIGLGKAQGRAEAVLTFLAARGIDVPQKARERISGCTDLDQLDTWVRRAATADSIDDLLTD